jgi:hypothetical protein
MYINIQGMPKGTLALAILDAAAMKALFVQVSSLS